MNTLPRLLSSLIALVCIVVGSAAAPAMAAPPPTLGADGVSFSMDVTTTLAQHAGAQRSAATTNNDLTDGAADNGWPDSGTQA